MSPRTRLTLVFAVIGAAAGAVLATRMQENGKPPEPAPGLAWSPMALCLYCWPLLSIYWGISGRGASAPRWSEAGASRSLHLVLITAAQVLAFWPFAGWPFATSEVPQFPRLLPEWPWLEMAGVAVAVAGLAFAIVARRALGKHWSGEVTLKVAHELVRAGPYRRIRHPIYTGVIAIFFGTALASGRWQGLIALAVVLAAYARKTAQEERVLLQEFGDAYVTYRRQAGALLPRFGAVARAERQPIS